MTQFLSHIKDVVPFVKGAFANHTLIAVVALIILFISVFMTNKLAAFCRYVVVIAAIAIGAFAFVFSRYQWFWTAAAALAVLIVIRLLLFTIRTIRQSRIDRRIEERALAKAASRRGSFKNRQGYSGHARPIEDDYVPGRMTRDEIKSVIENERAEIAAEISAAAAQEAPDPEPIPEALSVEAPEAVALAEESAVVEAIAAEPAISEAVPESPAPVAEAASSDEAADKLIQE